MKTKEKEYQFIWLVQLHENQRKRISIYLVSLIDGLQIWKENNEFEISLHFV